jgi:pilus assembly protein CpaB
VLPTWLHGAPYRLPGAADRVAEGWWLLSPRIRLLLGAAFAAMVLTAILLRVALSPYGPPAPVLVAAADLRVGEVLAGSDVIVARWPRELVPPGALSQRSAVVGGRMTMGVTAGTALTARHVTGEGPLTGLAPGLAAVPVPTSALRGASGGVLLDLVVTLGDGTGRTLARDVRVLAEEGGTTWLEIDRALAPDVAAAAARGTLSAAVLAG